MMYQKIFTADQLPPIGHIVTTFDELGRRDQMVYHGTYWAFRGHSETVTKDLPIAWLKELEGFTFKIGTHVHDRKDILSDPKKYVVTAQVYYTEDGLNYEKRYTLLYTEPNGLKRHIIANEDELIESI